MNRTVLFLAVAIGATAQENHITAPKIWDDKALEQWTTPIAALGIGPAHFTSAEYYAVPGENLRTYPVYRPDREPPGYWEWLNKRKPQPLVDAAKLRTRDDWVKAGEVAFRSIPDNNVRTDSPEKIRTFRDPKSYEGIWTQSDGSLPFQRWLVTKTGVQLVTVACTGCHARVRADGTVFWGVSTGSVPVGYRDLTPLRLSPVPDGDTLPIRAWRLFTVPWAPDERIEKLRDPTAGAALVTRLQQSRIPEVTSRGHGSPYYTTKMPDLNSVRYSLYMDATGTHRLRGAEDIARYAAFVTGADPMEFGSYKVLEQGQRRIRFRYSDEVLYAIGVYLMSLDPPKNIELAPAAVVAYGREIFAREACITCHVPPNYTSGKLTVAQGYTPPPDHPYQNDIVNRSVGTDSGLALKTRKGTGFYKIPSLRGIWYRPVLLHDGSIASLEEMFDTARLRPDHEPGGWKGPNVTRRAIPGHPFGLELNAEDKAALIAFLRSI